VQSSAVEGEEPSDADKKQIEGRKDLNWELMKRII
jgi:hypothetical protein